MTPPVEPGSCLHHAISPVLLGLFLTIAGLCMSDPTIQGLELLGPVFPETLVSAQATYNDPRLVSTCQVECRLSLKGE